MEASLGRLVESRGDTLDYYDWRNAVFNQPIRDLEHADYESDAFFLSLDEAFDHIDRALMDDGLYSFKEEQLVIGFSLIFGKTFTDYPWCYTRLPTYGVCHLVACGC